MDFSSWEDDDIFDSIESDSAQGGNKSKEGDDDDVMMDQFVEEDENEDDFIEHGQLIGDDDDDVEVNGNEMHEGSNVVAHERKKRGPTMMHAVHVREHRISIILNKFGQ
ncbi:unnamed protein product, partial [Cuscuta epithymum]